MSYGFKLNLDQDLPTGDLTLNVNIRSSEISTSYTMTGSIDDNFMGDGIFAFYNDAGYIGEPTDIYNDTVTFTEESEFVPLSGISQSIISDIISDESKMSQVSVKINGQDTTWAGEGWMLVLEGTVEEPIKYAGVALLQSDDGFNFYFLALQEDPDTGDRSPLPGNYTVEIKYPALVTELDITVDAYTSEDVGDEYQVDVTASETTQEFKHAMIESGLVASPTFLVHITSDGQGGYTADKTYDQIIEAVNNGMAVFAITPDGITIPFDGIQG